MNQAQRINQTSGKVEYYTPAFILEAARQVMGGIDLDPASSARANENVRAKTFWTAEDNPLGKQWIGRVWMNHPFTRERNRLWVNKLAQSYGNGVTEACCITFAATSEKWFQPLLAQVQCFLCPRTDYYLPDGSKLRGVTKGSVVTYFGNNPGKFAQIFSDFGIVKKPA